jgi:hypothetical protein
MNAENTSLRAPSIVMSPRRAGVVVPNALSFSRAAMRELVRGRYRVEKVRFDLDSEGRGEVLYRLIGGGWTFHFFLVSTKLPEEQKTDRNFAQSWDAMGVLCQGEWTAEREARLRREVPKQRAGYADYDTLIYARGNRSARLFDHVVESLAAGRQPDPHLLAPVGYILRTTAFIGNGQLGTRPFAGYEPDHPLRRPYHAQFCSAFMLREYVFDLVDHMARARNPRAARLARPYRRYLGLGNAAATGLVPFVVNHPHLMHRWCLAYETALARAEHRPAKPDDDVTHRFGRLLDRSIRHFIESERPSDGVFSTPQDLAADLSRLRAAFEEFRAHGTVESKPTPLPWVALHDWAERHLHPEAAEILSAIVIEIHPDIVDAAADDFYADERFEVQPEMTVAQLRDIVQEQYAWALAPHYRDVPAQHFWYRSSKAPRDVRRGLRGRDQALEAETSMDTVLQTQRLWAFLERARHDARVADIVCVRPDLRHIVARIQSLAGLQYAELREHWLASGFSPFAPVRFALSFYGLEKFEAAVPKSVRGTFMQGAPIAEDVADGIDGDWPFPLMPTSETSTQPLTLAPLPMSIGGAAVSAAADAAERSESLIIAPRELARMVQTALQGHGAALGVAEDAASLVMFSQACGEPAVAALLQQCSDGRVSRHGRVDVVNRGEALALLDAHESSALLAAPAAFDLAYALAHTNTHGVGAAVVSQAVDAWMVNELALKSARRHTIGLLMWQSPISNRAMSCGYAVAGPGESGPWYARSTSAAPSSLQEALLAAAADAAETVEASDALRALVGTTPLELASAVAMALEPARDAQVDPQGSFAIVCIRPPSPGVADTVFDALARSDLGGSVWTSAEVCHRHEAWLRRGVTLLRSEFAALGEAGAALLVPEAQEPRLLKEGADPLKVF